MALFRFDEDAPLLEEGAWVAESATVLGRVRLGSQASVWYGAVLRGDNEWIEVGARTNLQDGCILHTDAGLPLAIGADVTVGHQAMLHSCTIGDRTLIGMQAVLLNGARIGADSIVAAGSLVAEGKQFPDGVLIMGTPARAVRQLSDAEIAGLRAGAAHYVEHAALHRDRVARITPADADAATSKTNP